MEHVVIGFGTAACDMLSKVDYTVKKQDQAVVVRRSCHSTVPGSMVEPS